MVIDTVRSHHLRARGERWSRALGVASLLLLSACGTTATLVEATADGGVVTYAYNPALGHEASPFRDDALALIGQRCGGAYAIVREGRTRTRFREVSTVAGPEVIEEHRWGIRFRCDGARPRATGAPLLRRSAPGE